MESNSQGKIESLFADFGRKMDSMLGKAKQASEQHNINDTLDDLNRAKDRLENELNQFVNDDEKWSEVKENLLTAASELKKAFEITFRKKPNSGNGAPPPPANPAGDYEKPDERTLGTP